MSQSNTTPKNRQASEREDDFLPHDQEPSLNLLEPQSMISTIDPMTGNDVGNVEGKPSIVDGNLTMYFESEQTRQAYLDEPNNPTLNLPATPQTVKQKAD